MAKMSLNNQFDKTNITEICRACLQTCEEYKTLFDKAACIDKRIWADVFSDVVKIEIISNIETAPNRICITCSNDLTNAYNFIKKSQQNNERLLQYLNAKERDSLTEFPVNLQNDQHIPDLHQIKVEDEASHDYNESMVEDFPENTFDSDGSDNESFNKSGKIPKLECGYCNRIFTKQDLYENHMEIHREEDQKIKEEECEEETQHNCEECGFSCYSNIEMIKHQQTTHTTSCVAVAKPEKLTFRKKMQKKSIKITQPQQFEKLIAILKEQPELARGRASMQIHKAQWAKIAVELNSFGPPSRTSKEWQRVWIHYKANLKRKLNKKTTEGSSLDNVNLTQMEETVMGFFEPQNLLNPTGKTTVPQPKSSSLSEDEMKEDHMENRPPKQIDVAPPLVAKSGVKKKIKKMQEEPIADDIKIKTYYQKEILETLKNIEKFMSKNYEVNKQIFELKKKKSLQATEVHALNVQLKKRKIQSLDMQLQSLN